MTKVLLVSMPYTILHMPSIAIAQLKAVAEKSMKERIKVDSAHCFIDFAEYMGLKNYKELGTYAHKGLHDWMFRHIAFDLPDNPAKYEQYFFSDGQSPKKRKFFQAVIDKYAGIGNFLDGLIADYHMADYDIVGFTSMMSQSISSFALANRIKQIRPDIITILGGPNCEYPMGKTIADHVPHIDYVFSGEGLISFPIFLKAIDASNREAISDICGIHGARHNTVANQSPTSKLPASVNHEINENTTDESFDLNELPLLDYSEYLERVKSSTLREHLLGKLVLPFQTSTGCWKADKIPCSFCGLTPNLFRQMDASAAIGHINGLIDRYAGDFFIFEATDPCMPIEYPKDVFPEINRGKQTILQYECRANTPVDDLKKMVQANVLLPQPGIESLSTKTLKLMRKGVTAFQNVQFLKYSVEQGLYPIWNHLYGLPEDTYNDLNSRKLINDIQTLYHMPPPTSSIPISFQRYSEYFNNCDKYQLKLDPSDHYYQIYPFDTETINDLAYTYTDKVFYENLTVRNSEILQAINLEIVIWMYKFRESMPKLYFKDQLVIYDSRYDKPVEHMLSQTEKDLLLFMNKPKKIENIAENFSMSIDQTERFINHFLKKRFLFTERCKYLNIVCEQCLIDSDTYQEYYVDFVRNSSTGFE